MDSLDDQTVPLVDYVSQAVGRTHAFGNLTSQVYDTAWVSMVRKPNNYAPGILSPGPLFPECLQYVLDQQLPCGGWESYDSDMDGVVNTLAGLLALKKNSYPPHSGIPPKDMKVRIEGAIKFLEEKLEVLDIASTDHVGFEIIIPSMLELLEQEGISFDFPSKALLMELNQKKLSKIPSSIWSGKLQTTITHSLEAFAGKQDFSGLQNQRIFGGMGSSPSSTAAYLMYSATWDEQAENYLRMVISSRKPGPGYGGVPGMYPTTGFEVLWIASTLLEGGFDVAKLSGIKSVLDITEEFYETLDELASGFSRYSVPDADDTAKSIITRNLLGKPTAPDKLIKIFEGSDHFLTYMMERHPSLTTNCNVLSAILESPNPINYILQIEKAAKFLCFSWLRADVSFMDKWNISEFYPLMLMSEALIRLVKSWDQATIKSLSDDLIRHQIPLVLFQALMQTLQKQNSNGSWGPKPSREITSYAIIALCHLSSLPFLSQELSFQISTAISKGRSFISDPNNKIPEIEYVWISKVTYSPINISKAYILAGLNMNYPKYSLSPKLKDLLEIPQKGVHKYTQMYSNLPLLKGCPPWRVQGCVFEGYLLLQRLKLIRLDMFGRENVKRDEYFDFIAMTFACGNNLKSSFLRTNVLFDMMFMVLRIYQIDEYMEHIIGKRFSHATEHIKRIITNLFQGEIVANGLSVSRTIDSDTNDDHKQRITNDDFSDVKSKLKSFISSILNHQSIASSNTYDQNLLKHELHNCLLSHVIQLEDSQHYYNQKDSAGKWKIPRGSYHAWAHSTASSHSCAPLSLAFLRCLLQNDKHRKRSAEEQYLFQDIWMHLSNKARMENDRASLQRDRNERNLNSLDFPEFSQAANLDAKDQISNILKYEKKCCQVALDALEQLTGKAKSTDVEALRFYYFLTEVYNEIYTLKDISSERMTAQETPV
ncbi:ent-kaurene synthase [Geopyxis carbonaria]|nr:ent-kaurene synthase [Geopyxis carbonaria]